MYSSILFRRGAKNKVIFNKSIATRPCNFYRENVPLEGPVNKKVIFFSTVPPFLAPDSVSEVQCKIAEPSEMNNFSTIIVTQHSTTKLNYQDDNQEVPLLL